MQKLTIERTNGNVPRLLPSEDHISGLVFYNATLPTPPVNEGEEADADADKFSTTERIKAISSIETAEKYGITADADDWGIRVLHYQLSCIFGQNAAISLYVGIFAPVTQDPTFSEIKQMQNYAEGRLRQVGVWNGAKELAVADITALQTQRNLLEQQDRPLVILYSPKVADVTKLPTNIAGANRNGVSVLIGQDGAGKGASLYKDAANKTAKASVGCVGEALGILSKASVHHSIAWIEQYPTLFSVAAFADGTLYKKHDRAVVESLDSERYLFVQPVDGIAGVFFNDSHNLDSATSDYAYIENVRTMDKAVRSVRTYVLPKLGRPMQVDASTGQLATHEVEYLVTVANKGLEDMEKAGELSGYMVEIDPDQDILSTSRVEMVIRNVAVGIMRTVHIKIGYTTSI